MLRGIDRGLHRIRRAALRRAEAAHRRPRHQDEPRRRPERVHLHAGAGPDGAHQRAERAREVGRPHGLQPRPRREHEPAPRREPADVRRQQLGRHHLRRLGRRLDPRRRRRRRDQRRGGHRRRRHVGVRAALRLRRRPDRPRVHRLRAPVEPRRRAPLRRRHQPLARQQPQRAAPRRVLPLRRIRPASSDPLRRIRRHVGLHVLLAERAHMHRQPEPEPLPEPVLPEQRGPHRQLLHRRRRQGRVHRRRQPGPVHRLEGQPGDRRQRRDLRRPRQRLVGRRHGSGHDLGRLGQRPVERRRRPPLRVRHDAAQRHLHADR